MAVDWIHCNKCKKLPAGSTDGPFFLTSCQHLLCKRCVEAQLSHLGPRRSFTDNCPVCREAARLTEVNQNMGVELQMLFLDQKDVVKKLHKQFSQIVDFQNMQRKLLLDHLESTWKEMTKMMQHMQEEMRKKAQLDKEEQMLEAELNQIQSENRSLRNSIHQLASRQRRVTPNVGLYRSMPQTPSGISPTGISGLSRTPNNPFMSFETAFTSTPMDSAATNVTNLTNRMRLSPSIGFRIGQQQQHPPHTSSHPNRADPNLSEAPSEVTTPKMLGFRQSSSAESLMSNSYKNVYWNSGANRSHERLNSIRSHTPATVKLF